MKHRMVIPRNPRRHVIAAAMPRGDPEACLSRIAASLNKESVEERLNQREVQSTGQPVDIVATRDRARARNETT